jgi:hypothetical protein
VVLALLGCYKTYTGSCLLTFRHNLLLPNSRVKQSKKNAGKQLNPLLLWYPPFLRLYQTPNFPSSPNPTPLLTLSLLCSLWWRQFCASFHFVFPIFLWVPNSRVRSHFICPLLLVFWSLLPGPLFIFISPHVLVWTSCSSNQIGSFTSWRTNHRPRLPLYNMDSPVARHPSWTAWPFKMGAATGCPETSANNYLHTLRNVPEN